MLERRGIDTTTVAATSQIRDYSNRLTLSRAPMARILKGVGTAALALQVAGSVAKAGYDFALETAQRGASTIHQMSRQEFGGGSVIFNSQMATERQRAMQAIGNAQMNARSLMGNEAAYNH